MLSFVVRALSATHPRPFATARAPLVAPSSAGYPHTTANAELRPHAIACIWLVNGLWLIAPLFSCLWAVVRLADMVGGGSAAADGNKKDN